MFLKDGADDGGINAIDLFRECADLMGDTIIHAWLSEGRELC